MQRIRFKAVPIGSKCQTEWHDDLIKTNLVRIITDASVNYVNAVNLSNGQLEPHDSSEWVWVNEGNSEPKDAKTKAASTSEIIEYLQTYEKVYGNGAVHKITKCENGNPQITGYKFHITDKNEKELVIEIPLIPKETIYRNKEDNT